MSHAIQQPALPKANPIIILYLKLTPSAQLVKEQDPHHRGKHLLPIFGLIAFPALRLDPNNTSKALSEKGKFYY